MNIKCIETVLLEQREEFNTRLLLQNKNQYSKPDKAEGLQFLFLRNHLQQYFLRKTKFPEQKSAICRKMHYHIAFKSCFFKPGFFLSISGM